MAFLMMQRAQPHNVKRAGVVVMVPMYSRRAATDNAGRFDEFAALHSGIDALIVGVSLLSFVAFADALCFPSLVVVSAILRFLLRMPVVVVSRIRPVA